MKQSLSMISLFITFLSSIAIASNQPIVKGRSTIYNGARSYELVIDGATAQKIYDTLSVEPKFVDSTNRGWMTKAADSIACGQNLETKKYSCSMSVDENGVQ